VTNLPEGQATLESRLEDLRTQTERVSRSFNPSARRSCADPTSFPPVPLETLRSPLSTLIHLHDPQRLQPQTNFDLQRPDSS
jgi:hypothetical protein